MVPEISQINSNTFRRFVVRIDANNGNSGTGFFVAPGIILTAAHVVGDSETVRVLPHESVAPTLLAAKVEFRSDSPDTSALWPYPDLAVLRLSNLIQHPCVWLEYGPPALTKDCFTWGFSEREVDQLPVGSPVSFQYEGEEGDGYLKLKFGQAQPGLSGAPLLCLEQRAVVGIISATRDPSSSLGGWATSIQSISTSNVLFPKESVPSAIFSEITELNRQKVLSNRGEWHSTFGVERIPDDIEQSWGTFQNRPYASPVDLLLCEYGVVPYLFRDEELADMLNWCHSEEAMSVSWVSGAGGAGKTRYAIEICKQLAESGWTTGFLADDDTSAGSSVLTEVSMSPKFIVIDYSEGITPTKIADILNTLRKRATDISPVRVLLLTRRSSTFEHDPLVQVRRVAKPPLLDILACASERLNATIKLSIAQRASLYSEAVYNFSLTRNEKIKCQEQTIQLPDFSADHYSEPLSVLFEALDYSMGGESGPAGNGKPAVDRILIHEQRYWDRSAPKESNSELNILCVAIATLFGAKELDEAEILLENGIIELRGPSKSSLRRQMATWLNSLYTGPKFLNPLRPDRLGEALISNLLLKMEASNFGTQQSGSSTLIRLLERSNSEQSRHAIDLLGRINQYDTVFNNFIESIIPQFPKHLFLGDNLDNSNFTEVNKWDISIDDFDVEVEVDEDYDKADDDDLMANTDEDIWSWDHDDEIIITAPNTNDDI